MRQLHVIAIVAALGGGCGGDVDLGGMYRVDVAVGSRPCGTDVPVSFASAYVRLTKGDLFGTEYFAYDACSDEAGMDCSSVGGLLGGFFEPIDDGWMGRSSFASNSGLNCSLGITVTTAILRGDQLEIEGSTHQDRIEITEDRCTPEEAETRGDAMPCTEHDRIEATRR